MLRKVCTLGIVFACAVAGVAQAPGFDFKTRIGIADVNAAKQVCLSVPGQELALGSKVTLISSGGRQYIGQAMVETKVTEPCSEHTGGEGSSFYLLKLAPGSSRFGSENSARLPGIALVDPPRGLRVVRGKVTGDLNGDGKNEYFRQCTSREGVHFTVWTGRPLRGLRVWNTYYYLGYDVVPNCNQKDSAE
jgi:hypothetical protein